MARSFDGSNDYLSAARPSSLGTSSACSVAMWVKELGGAGALKGFYGLATGSGSSTQIILAYFDGSRNGIFVSIGPDSVDSSKPASAVTITNWNHLVVVRTNGTTRPTLYINGVQNDAADTSFLSAWADAEHIGRGVNSSFYANCAIAEQALWDVQLTAADAAVLGAGYSPLFVKPESLLRYRPLIGRTSPEIELMEGVTMTLNDAPATYEHPRIIYPARRRVHYKTIGGAAGKPWLYYANQMAQMHGGA